MGGDETVFTIAPKTETEEELIVEMRRIPLDDLKITSDEKKLKCEGKTFTKINYVEEEDCKDVDRKICRDLPGSGNTKGDRESFQDVCHTEYATECSLSHNTSGYSAPSHPGSSHSAPSHRGSSGYSAPSHSGSSYS